jgi:hypothetical protein
MESLPLWPTYIGEKGRTLGKTKRVTIGNTLGEHTGSLKGTYKEHVGNKGKMKKILPQRHPTLKRKKSRHLECMMQPTHWLYVFLVSKTKVILLLCVYCK